MELDGRPEREIIAIPWDWVSEGSRGGGKIDVWLEGKRWWSLQVESLLWYTMRIALNLIMEAIHVLGYISNAP